MRRYFVLIFAIMFCAFVAKGQQGQKKFINPDGIGKPNGYSQVVVSGGTVYISGQVSANEKGEVIGKGDLKAQTIKVFENLKVCLASAGLNFTDVVKVNYLVVNVKPADVAIIREVRSTYLPTENPPASTLAGVTSLVNPDFLIEIEVIARIR